MIHVGVKKTEFDGDYVHLYVWDSDVKGGTVHHHQQLVWRGNQTLERVPTKEGAAAKEPSLVFERDVWDALRQLLVRDLADRDALNDHLQDAVRVRDRLLAIVERP